MEQGTGMEPRCSGSLILLGWKLRWTALALGGFLVAVTGFVHLPGLFSYPPGVSLECHWMWDILQRTNLVKNLCLLGVCFHLLHHRVGDNFLSCQDKK